MADRENKEAPFLFANAPSDTDKLPARVRERLGPDYIPGYSEKVMANDLSTSNVLTTSVKEKYYKRDFGTGPGHLAVEFKWVRVQGPTGEDSYNATQDQYEYTKRGYKAVTVQDKKDFVQQFQRAGVTGFPPAAHVGSDGLIRHRDSALYYVDRATADRLENERIEDNKRILGHNQPGGEVQPSAYDFEFDADDDANFTERFGLQT